MSDETLADVERSRLLSKDDGWSEQEDQAAFSEWMHANLEMVMPKNVIERVGHLRIFLRWAFDAGMARGLEKRGCCEQERDA